MHKKIGNLSFSIKNNMLFVKQYCHHQKSMVVDLGTFSLESMGAWCEGESVTISTHNSQDVNYTFNSNSEHNAKTFVTKLSNDIDRLLFSEKDESLKNNQLRIEDKG